MKVIVKVMFGSEIIYNVIYCDTTKDKQIIFIKSLLKLMEKLKNGQR